MLKTLKIGLLCLVISSCSTYIIKDPQPVYVINHKFGAIAKGSKNFNVKNGPDKMGAWVESPVLIKWSELPENIIAFPLETWLTQIKPALKSMARKYRDDRD